VLVGLALATLGFDFLGSSSGPGTAGVLSIGSLLAPLAWKETTEGFYPAPAVVWLFSGVFLVGIALAVARVRDRARAATAFGAIAGVMALSFTMPYVLLRQRGAAGQVDADLQAIALFVGFAILSMVIIAGVPVVLGQQVAKGGKLTARWPLLAVVVVAGIAASWSGNARAYWADVLSRRSSEVGSRSELSVQLARRAVEVSPSLDRPALVLGQASLRHAVTLTDPGRREMMFDGAEAALLRARAINPFNPDHTMMLASLHRVWSDLAV
jgi:hypothetical protein